MLRVSVIIPTYKPGAYLLDCIKSVIYQSLSFDLFEVLIILNGPKDPFYVQINDVILPYKNFGLIYEERVGVSNARNAGIQNAKGEFICFVDDDDVLSPSYLERLLDKASENTISISNVYSFKNDINERKENFFICKHLKYKELYKGRSFFVCRSFLSFPVAKMIHRNIIGTHRFNTRFKNGEDALFITSITDNLAGINFTSDDAIYYVRERIGSASRRKINMLHLILDSFCLIKEYIVTYLSHPSRYDLKLFVARIPGVIKNAYLLLKN